MNMNFIAFSSRAKLLDRPRLDAAASGHRPLDAGVRLLLGHCVRFVLDRIYQADGLHTPSAAGANLGAAGVKIDYRVVWRSVRARAQRCADKDQSPARP